MSALVTAEAANSEFYAAFEAVDLDRMSAVWADGPYADSVTCVHPGWPMLRGRGEVLRSWALIMANTPFIQFVLTDVRTQMCGDHAIVTCAENILAATTEEDAAGFGAGGSVVATNIFVRADGAWRLLVHHGSPILNRSAEDDPEG